MAEAKGFNAKNIFYFMPAAMLGYSRTHDLALAAWDGLCGEWYILWVFISMLWKWMHG